MKKALSFLLFLTLNVSPLALFAQPQDGPHIAFEQTEYDFGEIPHKSKKVECRFEFTNDGSAPLVITRTLTSCNCVKVSYDKKPVPPGQKGTITVTYEVSKKDPGVFYKVIEVYSNSAGKRNSLIIKGNSVE
jgi:hypothetical protein